MGNYNGIGGKKAADAINRNKKTVASQRSEERSRKVNEGKETGFKVTNAQGKEVSLYTKVEGDKIRISQTKEGLKTSTQYWDFKHSMSIKDNILSHVQSGTKIETI